MGKEKIKVYTYTRVSTAMQIDGYSLDAQKSRMKAFADYNDYEIVREYQDAGKSGRSIEGRAQFIQMMDDIKTEKDGVSYVLVFKLSRFGRNAADVLSSLQIMQDYGVNLICVEDGIDSSKDAGKLIISVLSAVAEIEKENIRVQTMEGRMQRAQAKRYEHVNRATGEKIHMLSGIVRCPICGAGMYGNKSIKKRPDGTNYKDYFYYGCKHRLLTRGHKCTYRNQVNEEVLDKSVAEVVSRLVSRPKFAQLMQNKINTQVDTTVIDQEIKTCEKNLRNNTSLKIKLIEEMDALDFEDKHYDRKIADLNARLDKAYDKIEELEDRLFAAKAKKSAIEAEQVTAENIYRVLRSFNSLYKVMDDEERRKLMEALIAEVQIYEDKKETGQ